MILDRRRSKGIYTSDIGANDIYRFYCKRYDNPYKLTQKQYSTVLSEFNSAIMKLMIEKAYVFLVPYTKFSLYIRGRKIKLIEMPNGEISKKGLRVNWKATTDLWEVDSDAYSRRQIVYHFNEHSARRNFRFILDIRRSRIRNRGLFMFLPARQWSRYLAKHIKENYNNVTYYE